MEILRERSDGMWRSQNSIRFWGHSHHTMGTTPTGQDESELLQRARDCGDFFIRAILNKQGRVEITVYLYADGILVRDVEWALYEPRDVGRRDRWADEIADKVKVHTYAPLVKGGVETCTKGERLGQQLAAAEADAQDFPPLAPVQASEFHNAGGNNGWDGVKRVHTLAGTELEEEAGPENLWRGKVPMGAARKRGGRGVL